VYSTRVLPYMIGYQLLTLLLLVLIYKRLSYEVPIFKQVCFFFL